MSAFGLICLMAKTGILETSRKREKRNDRIVYAALLIDALSLVAELTLGSLSAQGRLFSDLTKNRTATIAFFVFAGANFVTNLLLLSFLNNYAKNKQIERARANGGDDLAPSNEERAGYASRDRDDSGSEDSNYL